MCDIFSVQGDNLSQGYINIRNARARPEEEIRAIVQRMWAAYEPFADADFCEGFARDVDGRFWEMFLGYTLLEAGYELLPNCERLAEGGQPDLCVLTEGVRICIEATTPTIGVPGPDQVVGPVPVNEGGGVAPMPVRQSQLRTTSAFWTKAQIVQRYINEGVIEPGDVRLIAISASRFPLYASEDPPLVMSSLFPIGDQYVTVNSATGEVAEVGYQHAPVIERQGEDVPRTAFIDEQFSHISGVIWSRISLGNLSRENRPITLVHNPFAEVRLHEFWGPWDREFTCRNESNQWVSLDIRNS